jgi:hypothetical protein
MKKIRRTNFGYNPGILIPRDINQPPVKRYIIVPTQQHLILNYAVQKIIL